MAENILRGDEEENKQEEMSDKRQKMLYGGVAAAVVLFAVIFLLGFSWRALRHLASDSVTLRIARAIDLPAGFVNGQLVRYADFADDLQVVQKFYQTQSNGVAPTLAEIKQSVWERLAKNAVTQKLAEQFNLSVSTKDVEAEYDGFVKNVGDAEQAKTLVRTNYGLSVNDFKRKVIKPYLLQEKVAATKEMTDLLDGRAKQKAEMVLAKVRAGEAFADLAKSYGEDDTRQKGGDLGWFGKGVMVQEFEDAVAKMTVGQTSELVKTRFGYHIIKLLETRKDKNGATEWHVSHILSRPPAFNDYLSELLKQAKIWQWIKI